MHIVAASHAFLGGIPQGILGAVIASAIGLCLLALVLRLLGR